MCLCIFWTKLNIFKRVLSNSVVLNTMLNPYYFLEGPFKFRMHLYLADNNIIACTVNPEKKQFAHERQKDFQIDPFYLELQFASYSERKDLKKEIQQSASLRKH